MKTPISLTLAALCAWQAASANAGNPNPKNVNATNSKTPSVSQTNSSQTVYILVPVNSDQLGNLPMIQGQPTSPPNPTANINLVQAKGNSGGPSKPPVTVARNVNHRE
jgi:hypothetical protein